LYDGYWNRIHASWSFACAPKAAPARAAQRSAAQRSAVLVSTGEHWFVRRYINITNMMEVADLHICDVLLQVRAAIRSVCPLCAE
jgi:hypothetical protein